MALINNIAGVNMGAVPSAQPAPPPNALYNGIVQGVGAAAAGTPLGAAIAVYSALKQAVNLLPPGDVKRAITDFFKGGILLFVINLAKGRAFTSGEYRLGERYLDQVVSAAGPDTVKSYREVDDKIVPEAILFFTVVFGVRITTDDDLWALDEGATAYRQRPGLDYKGMGDISDAALQRAVFLKQNFFPSSTYNLSTWDLSKFAEYPLVSPIPDPYAFGKLYTGPLPGGGQATDGVILVNVDTPLSEIQTGIPGADGAQGSDNTLLWIGGGLLAVAGYMYYKKQKRKPKSVYGYR